MADDGAVLHFIERWLPLSEPFVHALITRSRRPGVVVATHPLEHLDQFPYRPVVSLAPLRRVVPGRWHRPALTAALMAVARQRRARLVHVHHGHAAHTVLGIHQRMRLPFVVSLHGHDVSAYADAHPGLFPSVLPRAAAVIVPSHYLVDAAVRQGAPPDRVHVIPSGVDTAFFRPSPVPTAPEALFVGRFVEKKGIDVLLAAWRVVAERVPGARLRILGYGPLESLARSGGPSVEVTIAPDQSAVREAMRRARVVVSPSRTASDGSVDSLVMVNLEAQASGRPVVTTQHGGIPEYIDHGVTALMVPEADARMFARVLLRVMTDDELASQLGAAGPAWAAQFDVNRCAALVDDVYDVVTT
jgi:glycosyltransferase involved in cell wall biosynthesis